MVAPVTHRAIRVHAINIVTVRDEQTVAAGLGLVHEALDPKRLAQLGDGLAGLEDVGASQLERLVRNPDTRGTPPHPHVILAGDLSSRRLPIALPPGHGLKRRMQFVKPSISHQAINTWQLNHLIIRQVVKRAYFSVE